MERLRKHYAIVKKGNRQGIATSLAHVMPALLTDYFLYRPILYPIISGKKFPARIIFYWIPIVSYISLIRKLNSRFNK